MSSAQKVECTDPSVASFWKECLRLNSTTRSALQRRWKDVPDVFWEGSHVLGVYLQFPIILLLGTAIILLLGTTIILLLETRKIPEQTHVRPVFCSWLPVSSQVRAEYVREHPQHWVLLLATFPHNMDSGQMKCQMSKQSMSIKIWKKLLPWLALSNVKTINVNVDLVETFTLSSGGWWGRWTWQAQCPPQLTESERFNS